MNIPKICKECGGSHLTFEAAVQNLGGCVDGRLRLNETSGVFYLGCDDCSETCAIIRADDVAQFLNDHMAWEKILDVLENPLDKSQ